MHEAWNWHVSITSTHTPSQDADAGVMEMWSPICTKTLSDGSTLWKGSANLGWTTNHLPWKPGMNKERAQDQESRSKRVIYNTPLSFLGLNIIMPCNGRAGLNAPSRFDQAEAVLWESSGALPPEVLPDKQPAGPGVTVLQEDWTKLSRSTGHHTKWDPREDGK